MLNSNLNNMNVRILNATLNGKSAGNPAMLAETVKRYADAHNMSREDAREDIADMVAEEMALLEQCTIAKVQSHSKSINNAMMLHADSSRV